MGSVKEWQAQRWVQQPPFGWDSLRVDGFDIRKEAFIFDFLTLYHLLTSNKLFTQKRHTTNHSLEEIIHGNYQPVLYHIKAQAKKPPELPSLGPFDKVKQLQPLH